jgi:alanine dehydrogenase
VEIATHGLEEAARRDAALAKGVNVYRGAVTSPPVAEAHGRDGSALSRLIPGVAD